MTTNFTVPFENTLLTHKSKLAVRVDENIVPKGDNPWHYMIPSGYISDGASTPRILWSIIPPFGRYLKAAVIHDYGYTNNPAELSRKEIDEIFLRQMLYDDVNPRLAKTMYYFVRAVSWYYWRKYNK